MLVSSTGFFDVFLTKKAGENSSSLHTLAPWLGGLNGCATWLSWRIAMASNLQGATSKVAKFAGGKWGPKRWNAVISWGSPGITGVADFYKAIWLWLKIIRPQKWPASFKPMANPFLSQSLCWPCLCPESRRCIPWVQKTSDQSQTQRKEGSTQRKVHDAKKTSPRHPWTSQKNPWTSPKHPWTSTTVTSNSENSQAIAAIAICETPQTKRRICSGGVRSHLLKLDQVWTVWTIPTHHNSFDPQQKILWFETSFYPPKITSSRVCPQFSDTLI